MDSDHPTKILYIAGAGRSGSTLLGTILGNIDRFCDLGEVHFLLDRGLQRNLLCACQAPLQQCRFWHEVLEDQSTPLDSLKISELLKLRNSVSRFRHIPLHALNCSSSFRQRASVYGKFLDELFRTIRLKTGARVIIDSSKRVHGHVLAQVPGVELYTLHLVRDSRATAFSWTRQKTYQPTNNQQSYMPTISPRTSSVHWMLDNLSAELLKSKTPHNLFMKYEDFVANPLKGIKTILQFVGEQPDSLPFSDERHVRLNVTHSVAGNPSRFHDGEVYIREDAEWKQKFCKRDCSQVTLMTWPFLKRYGYV